LNCILSLFWHKRGAKKIETIEEIPRVEKYIEEGEYDEAIKLLDNFEKNPHLKINERLKLYHLKGKLLIWQGKYDQAINLCEIMYRLSQSFNSELSLVDTLILFTHIYTYQFKHEKALNTIIEAEKIIKNINKESPEILLGKKAHLLYCQGLMFFHEGNSTKFYEFLEKSLALREKVGDKQDLAESLYFIGRTLVYDGNFHQGLEYVKRSLTLAKESKSMFYVGLCYNTLSAINSLKGKLDESIKFNEKSLAIFKKIKNPLVIGGLYNNLALLYQEKGDLIRALKNIELALEIDRNHDINPLKIDSIDTAIQIALEMDDIERSSNYFKELEQIMKQQNITNNERVHFLYLYNKSLLLRVSSLKSDQIRASEILKEIVEKDVSYLFEIKMRALLNLIEILLIEVKNTSNLELLDQIREYINQLFDHAINQKSHWLLVQSYLLNAKFDMITLDLNKAQETLIKAQELTIKYGMLQMNKKLSQELKNLLKQKKRWVSSNNSDKRILALANLIPLKEQIQYMLKKREGFRSML